MKGGIEVSKLIKINIYAERKQAEKKKLKIKKLEENLNEYNRWLKRTDNEDVVENYEKFLSI